jgi:hypothetical protein
MSESVSICAGTEDRPVLFDQITGCAYYFYEP